MAIPDWVKENFRTMLRAAEDGNLALMECTDAQTGESVYVACAVNPLLEGAYVFVPLAKLFSGNPYEELIPPADEGGSSRKRWQPFENEG